jgi:hypothetical protein
VATAARRGEAVGLGPTGGTTSETTRQGAASWLARLVAASRSGTEESQQPWPAALTPVGGAQQSCAAAGRAAADGAHGHGTCAVATKASAVSAAASERTPDVTFKWEHAAAVWSTGQLEGRGRGR